MVVLDEVVGKKASERPEFDEKYKEVICKKGAVCERSEHGAKPVNSNDLDLVRCSLCNIVYRKSLVRKYVCEKKL